MSTTLEPGAVLPIDSLISPTATGIGSRVLARTAGGNITLFAFDAGGTLNEHTTAFESLLLVLDGALTLTIGGRPVNAGAHSVVVLPANVTHSVRAEEPARMLLIMLRDQKAA